MKSGKSERKELTPFSISNPPPEVEFREIEIQNEYKRVQINGDDGSVSSADEALEPNLQSQQQQQDAEDVSSRLVVRV